MRTEKIIFLDLDDTLLDSKKQISKRNLRALDDVLADGHRFVVSTGRPLSATVPVIRETPLFREGVLALCFNGGLLCEPFSGNVLYSCTIPRSAVRNIFAQADAAGLHCHTFLPDCVAFRERSREQEFYMSRSIGPYVIDPGLPDSLSADPCKCLVAELDDHERLEAFRTNFVQPEDFPLDLFYSFMYYLEIVPKGINKGDALRRACEILDFPVERSIAIGDSGNDVDMLRASGFGCAMANAYDPVKKAADYITMNDCDHDGVAEILYKFVLS